MPSANEPILIELHRRIRAALRSPEATEAPRSVRRLLWFAAGQLHRLLVEPGRRTTSPRAREIRQVIEYASQTLDAWTEWLGNTAGAAKS